MNSFQDGKTSDSGIKNAYGGIRIHVGKRYRIKDTRRTARYRKNLTAFILDPISFIFLKDYQYSETNIVR